MAFEARPDHEKLASFFRDVADVMARHPDVSGGFVLAERAAQEEGEAFVDREVEAALVGDPPLDAATRFLLAQSAPRRRVCVKFGINPQTGERICLKWVDEG
jgi:hypothetical protein